MKIARKQRVFGLRAKRQSTSSLLLSGMATLTFDAGNYPIGVDTLEAALKRDHDALRRDATRAYHRLLYASDAA